jgi:type II secretory pathway pseudopilin PulG
MLHDEIARNAPRPNEEDASLSLWELFRQRWAFLLGFALIVFFVTTLFVPSLSKSKSKAQRETARYNLMEIGTAVRMFADDNNKRLPASLDELTNELQLDLINTIFTDPQNGQRFVYVGSGKKLNDLQSNSILAYSPTDKKGRAVLFADGRVEVINGPRFSELTNRGQSQFAAANDSVRQQFAATPLAVTVAGGNVVAPPLPSGELKSEDNRDKSKPADLEIAARGAGEPAANTPAASHLFGSGLQKFFKNTAEPANAVPVLAHFQVQQNGDAIRVVDADGSAYEGTLQMGSAVAQNVTAPAEMPVTSGTPSQFQSDELGAGKNTLQVAQNYFFRVTGTNRTLKQNVVFIGNLLAISNPTTNLKQSFNGGSGMGGGGGGGGQLQSVLTNQMPWSSSRITGTAMIGDTTNIEINAVPLLP